jgi:hypothetical protein
MVNPMREPLCSAAMNRMIYDGKRQNIAFQFTLCQHTRKSLLSDIKQGDREEKHAQYGPPG